MTGDPEFDDNHRVSTPNVILVHSLHQACNPRYELLTNLHLLPPVHLLH